MDSYETGQKLVLGVVIVTLAISLISVVASLMTGTGQAGQGIVRLLLNGGLCYFLLTGAGWARWVAGILYLLGGIGGVIGGIAVLQLGTIGVLALLLGIIYLAAAVILLFVPSVKEHFS